MKNQKKNFVRFAGAASAVVAFTAMGGWLSHALAQTSAKPGPFT